MSAMKQSRIVKWWRQPLPGIAGVSVLDLAIGLALAGWGVAMVTGYTHSTGRHGGVGAALAVLTMTLPVAWRRRNPVAVAAVLGAGAVFNSLAFGRMVRCGPSLPALMFGAFALGLYRAGRGRRPIALAMACLLVSGAVQCVSDPQLQPQVMIALTPILLALYAVGRLVDSRSAMVARLSQRNEELRQQRERRAQLAIQADRARIADGLDATLGSRIAEMAQTADAGRQALGSEPDTGRAQEAFSAIGERGRETLNHMRRVVGTLLDTERSKEPQPGLGQLDRLVDRTGPGVRLRITGQRRELPPGVELAAYRTVEHLLDAFEPTAGQRIDISVDFGRDLLELSVRGPARLLAEWQAALATAEARLAVHHGSLSSERPGDIWEAIARLPLPAYA
jgi:signal transduction histidine kinase